MNARLLLVMVATSPLARAIQTCSIERVNLTTSGLEAATGTYGWNGAFSSDGRWVAFLSNAANLIPNDSNGTYDVFVRDRALGTTERVSVDSFASQTIHDSGNFGLDISGDGRYVAFASSGVLANGDLNAAWDVYVRDRVAGQTILVSQNPQGVATDGHAVFPTISADGRFVAFKSDRSDIVLGDTNYTEDVFVRDLVTGVTERVTVDSSGAQGDGTSSDSSNGSNPPAMSADGRFVAFASTFTNLVANDTNIYEDVFLRDRLLGTTVRISERTGGVQANDYSFAPKVSPDGRWITFSSRATNLDTLAFGAMQVYLHDALTGVTTVESVSTSGTSGDGQSDYGQVSGDGRYVVFASIATNLVAGDDNAWRDVFRRDRLLAVTTRVLAGGIQGNNNSFAKDITDDGSEVLFSSFASNLVSNDGNNVEDMFVAACGNAPFVPYCFGVASACPCGNAGGALSGCENSLGAGGGRLVATGVALLSADTLSLEGSSMPNGPALYFQGTQQTNGGAGAPFGDGLRCIGGSVVRLRITANASGASRYPGTGDPSVSVRGQIGAPGLREYQTWYRNAAPFCSVATYNLSNGIEIDWRP